MKRRSYNPLMVGLHPVRSDFPMLRALFVGGIVCAVFWTLLWLIARTI